MVNSAMWFRSLSLALVSLVALLYLSSHNFRALDLGHVVGDCSIGHLSKDSISVYLESVAVVFSHSQFLNGSIADKDLGFYYLGLDPISELSAHPSS